MNEQRKYRKCQNDLWVAGSGVIAFSFWGIIKYFFLLLLQPDLLYRQLGLEPLTDSLLIFTNLSFFLMLFFDLGIMFHIGSAAHTEAKGTQKNNIYLFLSSLLLIINLSSLVTSFCHALRCRSIDWMNLASAFFDLVTQYFLFEVVINAIQIRKLRKNEIALP